ncbi:MAG TPA: hypothetical protein VIJ47_04660, partial [Acidimicrobiales bacterium]
MTNRQRVTGLLVAAALTAAACGSSSSHRSATNTSAPTGAVPVPGEAPVSNADPGPGPTSIAGVTVGLSEIVKASKPVALTPRTGTDDLYLAEQDGKVRVIRVTKTIDPRTNVVTKVTWGLDPDSVLDLSDETDAGGERGLLGI